MISRIQLVSKLDNKTVTNAILGKQFLGLSLVFKLEPQIINRTSREEQQMSLVTLWCPGVICFGDLSTCPLLRVKYTFLTIFVEGINVLKASRKNL